MIKEVVRETDIQGDLARILAVDMEFQEIRGRMLARYLDSLPEGSRVLLSGCGSVSRCLAEGHAKSLARHRVAFTDRDVESPGQFFGQRLLPTDLAVAFDPECVLLLTATYESAMRERLSGLPGERFRTLRQIVCMQMDDADRLEVLERVQAVAVQTAKELSERFAPEEKTLYLPDADWYGVNLAMLRVLREKGWRIVMLTRPNAISKMSAEALVAEGYADWAWTSPSAEYSRLFSLFLCAQYPFTIAMLWVLCTIIRHVARMIQYSVGPVVAQFDAFIMHILSDKHFANAFLQDSGMSYGQALAADKYIWENCAGFVYRNSEAAIGEVEQEYGRSNTRFKLIRCLDPSVYDRRHEVEKYSQSTGKIHLAFVCSLYSKKEITVQNSYPLDCIFEIIDTCTKQGMYLSIFNPEDFGAVAEFNVLREIAAQNEYITYSPVLPHDQLMKLLPRFDFGWICRRIDTVECRYPQVHLTHTPFTFLNAGLPVLVSPETEYAAEIIEQNGVGLVLKTEDWPRAAEILRAFDHETFAVRARAFAQSLSPQVLGDGLSRFYDEVRLAHKPKRPIRPAFLRQGKETGANSVRGA